MKACSPSHAGSTSTTRGFGITRGDADLPFDAASSRFWVGHENDSGNVLQTHIRSADSSLAELLHHEKEPSNEIVEGLYAGCCKHCREHVLTHERRRELLVSVASVDPTGHHVCRLDLAPDDPRRFPSLVALDVEAT